MSTLIVIDRYPKIKSKEIYPKIKSKKVNTINFKKIIKNQSMQCQNPFCREHIYVQMYAGLLNDLRCAKCLEIWVSPKFYQHIPIGAFTTCSKCNHQFEVTDRIENDSPICYNCDSNKTKPNYLELCYKKKQFHCSECKNYKTDTTFSPILHSNELLNNDIPKWMCLLCRNKVYTDF